MTQNPHAEKAKELLVHYFGIATGNAGDPQEVASIVDEIIAAVHLEIEREVRAALGRDEDGS